MNTLPKPILMAHFDEISLRGLNQVFFIRKLVSNIQKKFGARAVVRRGAKKIIVEPIETLEWAEMTQWADELRLVPGVANYSSALLVKSDIGSIKETAWQMWQLYKPVTYKIETTRSDKIFLIKSPEVSRLVGDFIDKKEKGKAKVDVRNPELVIKIEIDNPNTAVLGKKFEGMGGLPVGTSDKVLALLSGGIDSPVAAALMMKRGAEVVLVHFENRTLNKVNVRSKIERLAKALEKIQGEIKLIVVPFGDAQKAVVANVPADRRMLIYRRLMLAMAEKIAAREKCQALVTGDCLAQVASQTLRNLSVVYSGTKILKLTPLIGMNKREITDLAIRFGTFEISSEPYDDCCSFMVSEHPDTGARPRDIESAELGLEFEKLVEDAVLNSTGL